MPGKGRASNWSVGTERLEAPVGPRIYVWRLSYSKVPKGTVAGIWLCAFCARATPPIINKKHALTVYGAYFSIGLEDVRACWQIGGDGSLVRKQDIPDYPLNLVGQDMVPINSPLQVIHLTVEVLFGGSENAVADTPSGKTKIPRLQAIWLPDFSGPPVSVPWFLVQE